MLHTHRLLALDSLVWAICWLAHNLIHTLDELLPSLCHCPPPFTLALSCEKFVLPDLSQLLGEVIKLPSDHGNL